jgi:hypothetical protein
MKQKFRYPVFASVLALLLGSVTVIRAAAETAHYYDLDGRPLPQYESIYPALQQYFGAAVPERIIVRGSQGSISRFDYLREMVLISEYHLLNQALGTVAHESCHLCLENFTKGASVREEFRFFDEGLAEIFQSIIENRTAEYKAEALAVAALQHRRDNVAFAKVQKWSDYFGNPQIKTNYYAYPVGASFNYFIIDTYGMDRLFDFFKEIGATGALEESSRHVFKKDQAALEAEWLAYLETVPVSGEPPRIAGWFPEDGATGVSVATAEIYLEFDRPMHRLICLITNCNDGVCYRNAYWKTDRMLAVEVKLLPNHCYRIGLGNSEHRFLSREGMELPVTIWEFTTGAE